MQRAKVFRNNIFVGLLTKFSEKEYIFVYDKEYLRIPNIKPISLTFPLQTEEFLNMLRPLLEFHKEIMHP